MLAALKFVQGAVAKKDFLPAMTHFVIENGVVRSFNGVLALSAPIPIDINCKPKAETFIKAISGCQDVVTLSMTPAGRLKVVSGKFKAFVDCVQEATLHAEPEGERFDFDGLKFIEALTNLAPIIGIDAMRPWCNGVLFKGHSAYATNNIILAEHWMGTAFPVTVNVPRAAIKEILRIGAPPIYGQMTEHSITFHFENGKWVRSQLLETGWPDLSKVLNAPPNKPPAPIDSQLYEAIANLKPFADKLGRIYFTDGVASTSANPGEGASFELDKFFSSGIYQIDTLLALKPLANVVDFSAYPAPCVFYGDNVRGVIIGMRM